MGWASKEVDSGCTQTTAVINNLYHAIMYLWYASSRFAYMYVMYVNKYVLNAGMEYPARHAGVP